MKISPQYFLMLYLLNATVQYTQISLPTSCTMFYIYYTNLLHVLATYPVLAIFRELRVWPVCTAYMATCHR